MNTPCPVCLTLAERGRDRDYAEKRQYRCPRCGLFEISGTAVAMLASRIRQDENARARLSHAIRSGTSEKQPLFVSSTNLDELIQKQLPGVQQQLENLTRWLAAQLRDDQLGRVCFPSLESLASIVGAIDAGRVKRLIEYGVKQKMVEQGPNGALGLSPDGWRAIERKKPADEVNSKKITTSEGSFVIVKSHCNECHGERNAFQRASYTTKGHDDETSWSDTYDILECCGCSKSSVRHTFWFSEWDQFDQDPLSGKLRLIPGEKVTYWPPQTTRKTPDWSEKLEDNVIRAVLDEVYQALNAGMVVLASIGTRTLLDRAMFLRVGDPKGGFAAKLDLMIGKGHIGKDERDILEAMTDAGSAAAHRGFIPSTKTLATIIETVENFLHREFVLKTAAGEVRTQTPARP